MIAPDVGRGTRVAVGLSRPLAHVGTLLRYALGQSACSVARPRPGLVGRAVPVSVLDRAEQGACQDVVLSVGAPPSLQGAVPDVVLAPPTTSRALFPGFTHQPLGDGPLLALPVLPPHTPLAAPAGRCAPPSSSLGGMGSGKVASKQSGHWTGQLLRYGYCTPCTRVGRCLRPAAG